MTLSRRKQTKKPSGYEYQALHLIVILLISFTILSEVFLKNQDEIDNFSFDKDSIPTLREDTNFNAQFPCTFPPAFVIQPFQKPNILFIVGDPTSLDPIEDQPFDLYMNSTLNYTVTYHDDNNIYSYEEYDAIVISQSIVEEGTVDSLYKAPIPILTMEAGTWNEFQLGPGYGITSSQVELNILNNSHYITTDLNLGYVEVYNVSGGIGYFTGYNILPVESDIIALARPNVHPPSKNHRSLVVLEKNQKDWNLTLAPERRAFWGAAQGLYLNQTGWETWEKVLKWILYDDRNGSATISVNVKDLDNKDVSNARVNLTHSYNTNQNSSQNTTITGQTLFSNIPYGSYNITVEFEDTINDTLSLLEIVGEYTYNMTANFNFIVRIDEYIDNEPPSISNIGFFPSNRTFHADVFDASTLTMVNLSLMATNASYTRNENYSMVTTDGIIYFNDTAAKDLVAVNVTYNITAIDIAGNIGISENYSFLLGDFTPPTIHEYNVTDYENGTLQFYANITDSQSDVQDPVILRINDSLVEMHLNASGYWVYRTEAYYAITLNYTIWWANDSVGNYETNPEVKFAFTPRFGLISPNDTTKPHIWGVSDTSAVHENGYVEFTSYINDWNEFQSGTNISSIELTLMVNGVKTSYPMTPIGAITYYFEFIFDFKDEVFYWINASDLAGNINSSNIHAFNITDIAIPIVSYWAEEWGNGTVDFHAEVIDWPNNDTTAFVSFTQNWFDTPWPNITMIEISDSQFTARVYDDQFQLEDIWYYVTANDSSDNYYEPTLDQSLNITVTDKVPPIIMYTIDNSTVNDGEITVTAYATDVFTFSNFVNNTFYINMTSDSTSMETTMDYNPIYRNWYKTHSFPYGEDVDIAIGVYDDTGNFGKRNFSIIVDDFAPPNITDKPPIVFQNGTTTIWAEVVEGTYGSGLKDVMIIYIRDNIKYDARMKQNNTGNIYLYSLSGFEAGQTFAYQITGTDNNNNLFTTNLKTVYIPDSTPPIYRAFDCTKELINHTATEIFFWTEVDDPFGEISGVNISINYFFTFQWSNWTSVMSYNGSHYIYSTQMLCNSSFSYFLTIYDEALNINVTSISDHKTLNFAPITAIGYGVEFNLAELNLGEVRFWVQTNDTFDEHTFFKDHNVTLSVLDETDGLWILSEKLMIYNGTHYIYNISIGYLHNFSYIMTIIDSGVLGGYYEAPQYVGSKQILDYWKPVIHSVGTHKIDENTIIIWANVSDWGSGVDKIFLYYDFSPSGGGGSGSEYQDEEMKFNGSLYICNLNFSETGDLNWYVEAYDASGNSNISPLQENGIVIEQPFTGFTLPEMILIILVLVIVFIIIAVASLNLRERRVLTIQRIKKFEERLEIISNIYTILVTTEVGVPIFNITNIMYQKDETLDDMISGLSVGIDTFLQSFQSDFLQQIQQDFEVSETENGINIRMSVIEQHKVQVLIAATLRFRIFVFLREQPSKFTRKAMFQTAEDLEKNITIRDLGIVDERVYGPQVELILQKFFPLTLLEPFVIDTIKLKALDEGLKRGRRDVPISSSAINSLKRLVVTHTLSKGKETNFDKIFNDAVRNGSLLESKMLFYNDAKSVMTKFLKIPPEQIYEALWTGCSPDVKIIIPQRV